MAEPYVSKARNPSKKDRAAAIFKRLKLAIDEKGMTTEEALETLTLDQYDFLVDYTNGKELDEYLLSKEQQESIGELMKKGAGRPTFPNGYEKKYPPEKRAFFEELTDFIKEKGGVIRPREKCNYRDIDFDLRGKHYRIVFSSPKS